MASEDATTFWKEAKLPLIASSPEHTYVETSHLFCKGFVEPLLAMGIVPDAIALTRPHREVAKSLHRLQTIPARTERGLQYLLSPDDPHVLALPEWQSLNDYQLCYWYCLEIERRIRMYSGRIRALGGTVAEISIDELSRIGGVNSVIRQLGLAPIPLRRRLIQKFIGTEVVNSKQSRAPMNDTNSLEELEADVLSRLATAGPNHT